MMTTQNGFRAGKPTRHKADADEVASALVGLMSSGSAVPPSMLPSVDLTVVMKFIDTVWEGGDAAAAEEPFRHAMRFALRISRQMLDDRQSLAARVRVLMSVFDFYWTKALGGQMRAARIAHRLLSRIYSHQDVCHSIPEFCAEIQLRIARNAALVDRRKAIEEYREALTLFDTLLEEKVSDGGLPCNAAFRAWVEKELADCLYEGSRHNEAAAHAEHSAKVFEELHVVEGVYASLVTQGLSLEATGRVDQAIDILGRVRELAAKRGDHERAVVVSAEIWGMLVGSGRYEAAERLVDEIASSVTFAPEIRSPHATQVAAFLRRAGRRDRAAAVLEESISFYCASDMREDALECMFQQIRAAICRGDLGTATRILRRARAVYRPDLGGTLRGDLYMHAGHIAYHSGHQFRRAAWAFRRAVRAYSDSGSLRRVHSAHVGYAMACTEMGFAEEGLDVLDRAFRMPFGQGWRDTAHVVAQAGSAFSRVGRYAEAIALLRRAVGEYQNHAAWQEAASPLRQLGAVYFHARQFQAAELCWRESLDLFAQQGNAHEAIATASNLVALATRLAQRTKAIRLISVTLRLLRKADAQELPYSVLLNFGRLLFELGRLRGALSVFGKAFSSARAEQVQPIRMARLHVNLSMVYLKIGQKRKALLHTRRAIGYFERARSRTELGRHRMGIMQMGLSVYAQAVRLCHDLGKPELAFLTIQQANCRSFFEAVSCVQACSPIDASPAQGKGTIAPILTEESGVSHQDPQFSLRYWTRETITAAKVDEMLGDRVLLQYFRWGNELFCVTLSEAGGPRVRSLPLPAGGTFTQKTGKLLSDFVGQPRDRQLLSSVQSALQEFYDILLRPVEAAFNGSRRLVVVPSQELFGIPFACLHDGQRYVVEQHHVSYLPHVGFLRPRDDNWSPSSWVGFGDPLGNLGYACRELQRIAAFVDNPRLCIGREATAANLLGQKADVLHVATRVIRDEGNPYRAALEVWSEKGPSRLTCSSIADHDVNARLAVLRCCFTGEAFASLGGEVAAIWTCFLLAGCEGVLASPWKVYEDKDVYDLMTRFYAMWTSGRSAVDALTMAQQEAVSSGVYPVYWGFPMLIGSA